MVSKGKDDRVCMSKINIITSIIKIEYAGNSLSNYIVDSFGSQDEVY